MTRDDLDGLLARQDKVLPGKPDWRDGTQIQTRRSYLPVSLDGALTGLQVALTVRLIEPTYLVANLIANRVCVSRLCLTGGHRDRVTRTTVIGGHIHRWRENRPAGQRIPKSLKLSRYEILPAEIADRDAALAFFLSDCGIESPGWWPMDWPVNQVLL